MKTVTTYLFAAFCALAAAGLVPSAAQAAVVLDLSPGGLLLGARNVDVGGTLYDVTFQAGTCAALFNGCDENSDFAFNATEMANSAAQVLLDQVFLDGPLGNFDSDSLLTNGCVNSFGCQIYIPFTKDGGGSQPILVSEALNLSAPNTDGIFPNSASEGHLRFYALFTPTVAVPEPASALLLGTGLIGAIALGRRGRRARFGAIAA